MGGYQYMSVLTSLSLFCAAGSVTPKVWGTVSTSDRASCGVMRNNRMSEGDLYEVRSYQMNRFTSLAYTQMPAECEIQFDFGDRFISVDLVKWWCKDAHQVGVTVFSGCGQRKEKILLNCSFTEPTRTSFFSSRSCVTVYHYRGPVRFGYDFELHIRADRDILSFSAEGIAAAFVGCLIAIMILLKIACVVTGYEERVPNLRTYTEGYDRTSKGSRHQSLNTDEAISDQELGDEDELSVADLSPAAVHILPSASAHSTLHGYGGDYDVPGPRRFSLYRTSSIFRK